MTGLFAFYRDHGDSPAANPPVDQWQPPFCGDIAMRIARDGVWFYNGTPIERPAMVRLFSRILRLENNRYFLVTPVEKVGITVEDAPFIATDARVENGDLVFHTNVGDTVTAGRDHGLRFETDADGAVRPYIEVRNGLEARLTPAAARDLLMHTVIEGDRIGVTSGGTFFAVAINTLTDD